MPHILPAHPSCLRPLKAARYAAIGVTLLLGSLGRAALAQPVDTDFAAASLPAGPEERNQPIPGQALPQGPDPAIAATDVWSRGNLLGTMGGLRPLLDNYGVSFGVTETSEVLGNPTGGRARGAVYEGLTQVSLGVDLEKAVGLPGGILNLGALQIHGRGLSANNIDNLTVVSGIEADRATRLFELWYQQSLFNGMVDVKVGQQSADLEFMTTAYGGLFINSSFGWPTPPSVDLPSGGPAYPLATPGIRLRVRPTDQVTVLLGLYDGNPAGDGLGDPQIRDPSGTNFNLNGGAFIIGEVQYVINQGDAATGLPGSYKLGAWYNSNKSPSQTYVLPPATNAAPASATLSKRDDWSIYAVMDQLVFRPPGSKDSGLGVFARAMGAPGVRSQINFFLDGGVSYKGLFGRDDDTVGLAVGVAKVSSAAQAGDTAFRAFTGKFYPIRTAETVLEATYQAQVAPWLSVQPDVQYVINPGAGILDPVSPTKRLGNALVFGLRTSVTF